MLLPVLRPQLALLELLCVVSAAGRDVQALLAKSTTEGSTHSEKARWTKACDRSSRNGGLCAVHFSEAQQGYFTSVSYQSKAQKVSPERRNRVDLIHYCGKGGAVGWEGADNPNLVAKLSVIRSAIER